MAALSARGLRVGAAKVGPDYIDPAFHAAALGQAGVTLDSWAMRPATLADAVARAGRGRDLVIAEGVMGLFDGADVPFGADDGSTAEVALQTGWPVVLVQDVRGSSATAAAVAAGLARARPGIGIKGVILNRVAGPRHRAMIERALAGFAPDIAVLGALPTTPALHLPSRHLGLVQAREHPDLAAFVRTAAKLVAGHVDLDRLVALAQPSRLNATETAPPIPPLGQRIAVAEDEAFAFAYPHVIEGWRRAGALVSFFSPLADQGPDLTADAVYLPGGYPELYAARLAAGNAFLPGLRRCAERGAAIFGECGGYMVLGKSMTDADGLTHPMAGLLPVATSMAGGRLCMGYRTAALVEATAWGQAGAGFRGHEFHLAAEVERHGAALFRLSDAAGRALPDGGARVGTVAGSFFHMIDQA